jgi:hypothetical protein
MMPSGRHTTTGALDHTLKKRVHKDQETDLHQRKKTHANYKSQLDKRKKMGHLILVYFKH